MCLDLSIPKPEIPPIFLPDESFVITISFGTLGVSCCFFRIPAPVIPIPNPIPPAVLIPLISAMNVAIATALPVLDQIHVPDCPRD